MSIPRKTKGTCPKCKTPFDMTVWDSVNTDLSPDITQKIISGEFFEQKCPKCGFVCLVENSMLYHDLRHRFLVWIIHPDENYKKNLDEAGKSSRLFSGYSSRVVHNVPELREKVSIIESGRDDCVIEFMKVVLMSQLAEIYPEFKVNRAVYISVNSKEYIQFYDSTDRQMHCELSKETYKEIEDMISPVLKKDVLPRFSRIDTRWALSIMDRLEEEEDAQALAYSEPPTASTPNASPISTTARFCRECGEKLLENSKFCHKCGTAVVMPPATVRKEQKPAQTTPMAPPKQVSTSKATPTTTVKREVKPTRRRRVRLIPAIIAIAIIAAVVWGTQSYWKAALLYDITFKGNHEITLEVGDSREVSYNTEIGDLSKSDIDWKSSDSSVATVSNSGVIKAKGEGQATITASINGFEKDSCTVKVTLKTVPVRNGEMIKKPRWTNYPEVTINAPSNANCFVYFKNLSNSANDFAFYVKAGSSATVNAPTGTYAFYYASGENWYGPDLKFGQGSSFFKSPDTFTLTEDDSSYDVLELTLYAVPNGNMDTNPIDESEFPM